MQLDGTMPKRLKLPSIAYLRTVPCLPVGEVYAALGANRGWAYQWRVRKGFPAATGGMIETSRLAAWLTECECRIEWI